MTPENDSTDVRKSGYSAARIADASSLVLLGVSLWWWLVATPVGVFVRLRDFVSPSMTVYLVGCIQIVRHLMWPRPSALSRLGDLRAAILARPHVAAALRAFLVTRPAVFIVALAAVITLGLTSTPGFVLSRDPLANLPARFDAGWYGGIALDGYTWDHTFQRQRNIAFFPALPMLMRPVGAVLGMYEEGPSRERRMLRGLWGGVAISLAAFLWALYYTSRLSNDLVGIDRGSAATLLLAAYPFALYFNAPYTESLFLLGAVGASYHFRRNETAPACVWGILAGLTRPNGFLVSVPLGILALQGETRLRALASRLAVAAMPAIGMLLFTLYLYQLTGGVWFAWARSHEAWGRSFEGFAPLMSFMEHLRDDSLLELIVNNPYNAINAAGVIFALLMTYPVFRKLGLAWAAFVLVTLLPPLLAGGLLSMGRLTSTLFPLFLALAAVLPPRSVAGWVAAFGIGQGFCAALFFSWRALF